LVGLPDHILQAGSNTQKTQHAQVVTVEFWTAGCVCEQWIGLPDNILQAGSNTQKSTTSKGVDC
jgi:hypothetical protein